MTLPLPLQIHRYRTGRVSVWLTNYADALTYWEAKKPNLLNPTLSAPLKTSPSIWRVDYMETKKEATK